MWNARDKEIKAVVETLLYNKLDRCPGHGTTIPCSQPLTHANNNNHAMEKKKSLIRMYKDTIFLSSHLFVCLF